PASPRRGEQRNKGDPPSTRPARSAAADTLAPGCTRKNSASRSLLCAVYRRRQPELPHRLPTPGNLYRYQNKRLAEWAVWICMKTNKIAKGKMGKTAEGRRREGIPLPVATGKSAQALDGKEVPVPYG